MAELTTLDIRDQVAWLTMDDGKVNAMSTAMLQAIGDGLGQAADAARVTVLQGRPGIFSAGFDLKTLQGGDQTAIRSMLEAGVETILKVLDHPHPVLTVCNGHCFPMGCFLMLAADARIGVDGDWRIGLNEVAIGLTLPRFALALARHRLTPPGCSLVTTGAMFPPRQAAELGYFDQVAEPALLDQRVASTVEGLLAVDLASHVATKQRVRGALREELIAAGID